jgi:hypothetical protein
MCATDLFLLLSLYAGGNSPSTSGHPCPVARGAVSPLASSSPQNLFRHVDTPTLDLPKGGGSSGALSIEGSSPWPLRVVEISRGIAIPVHGGDEASQRRDRAAAFTDTST